MPQIFAAGMQMGESPRWHEDRLWVCDWLAGEVLAFDGDGRRDVITRVAGMPFSIDWLPGGILVVTTPSGVVTGPDLTPYGATGQPFNEIVVDARGRVFVNMPGAPPGQPSRPGILTVIQADGSSRQVADDLWFPNGMAVTPDGSTLIVAESHANRLTAFTIGLNGDLSDRRVWAQLADAAPDGICLDNEGAVWYADLPHRRCVRVREGGEILQTVDADRGCYACMLGGADGRTLYIVANEWSGTQAGEGIILTQRVDVPHAGRP